MFLMARYMVAAAVFLNASAASAVEDATLNADHVLRGCTAFIADDSPRDIHALFQAGRCIGLMQGLGYASRLVGVCPPAEVTLAQRARVAVTYIEARPERMYEDFRVLAVEAMQKAWPCK
jgi:Rap1a immunity proteins